MEKTETLACEENATKAIEETKEGEQEEGSDRPAPSLSAGPRSPASPEDPARGGVDLGRLLALPLDQFAEAGQLLEVRVSWWPVPLWLVSTPADAETLAAEGVSRGRVWTAGELADLFSVPGLTPAGARTVALAKLAVDGDVVAVRRSAPMPSAPAAAAPAQLDLGSPTVTSAADAAGPDSEPLTPDGQQTTGRGG